MIPDIQYTHLTAALEAYGKDVAALYRQKLDAAGKNASRQLKDTLASYVERRGDVFSVYLQLQDYWQYLERGTRMQGPYRQRGKFPPLAPIENWIRVKPVIPYKGKDGRIPKPKQLAFLIARKIWRDGTRPFWFLRDTLAEINIEKAATEALKRDIGDWLQKIIENR